MAFDLAGVLARTRSLLMESGTSIWSDAIITESIRLAVGEISLEKGTAVTVKDLDSAGATTVATVMESALVVGAAAYAAAARAVDRAEQFELANESGNLAAWAESQGKNWQRLLRDGLNRLRLAELRASAVTTPWGAWEDDFGEVGKDDAE